MKNLKKKTIIILSVFFLILITGSLTLVFAIIKQWFGIQRSDWLNSLFAWISACSAAFLGIIVYLQNERFKIENDISTQESKATAEKYNQQLYSINSRMLQLEENKEKAFITFSQTIIKIFNDSDKFTLDEKPYVASFRCEKVENGQSTSDDCAVFAFKMVNLTDVPIRSIEMQDVSIFYKNWYTNERTDIIEFEKGGFIPSPLTQRNKEFLCTFVIPRTKNIAENLPENSEIVITLTVSTETVFSRETRQRFMLRLQKETAYFKAPCPHLFNLYCFESNQVSND